MRNPRGTMKVKLSKPVRQAIVSGTTTNHNSCQLVAHPFSTEGLYKLEVSSPKMNLIIDIDLHGPDATLLYTQAVFGKGPFETDFSEAELDALDPESSVIQTINSVLN